MTETDFRPTVSVVVTTYDRPDLCKRALESVCAQTYEPLEIIVVEDGTETDVEAWLDSEIPGAKYVRHEENRGLGAARNTGLSHASGDYIAYLDDDDEWKPERITKQLAELKSMSPAVREEVGVVYCGLEQRSPQGRTLAVSHPQNDGDLRTAIQDEGASTLPSTFLFDRSALLNVGGFDESLRSSIDHDIWMALATAGYNVVTVDELLVVTYESEAESMVTDTDSRIEGVRQYVEKWMPTYQSWFGVEAGTRYSECYFARIIARLVGAKFATGEFRDASRATRAIFEYSSQYRYNVSVIAYAITRSTARHTLPSSVVKGLRRAKLVLQHLSYVEN